LRLARAPSRPTKPLYVSSDSSSISIEVLPSDNNGGSTITAYEIWSETDGISAEDSAYDGSARYHTLTGLTPGAVYRISVRSMNSEGYSEFSELLEVAASSLPPTPTSLRKVMSLSSKTSIYLEWDKVPDQEV
jgi:hypothetical protein